MSIEKVFKSNSVVVIRIIVAQVTHGPRHRTTSLFTLAILQCDGTKRSQSTAAFRVVDLRAWPFCIRSCIANQNITACARDMMF